MLLFSNKYKKTIDILKKIVYNRNIEIHNKIYKKRMKEKWID